MVDIECPFQFGRLRELHEFSWDGVLGDSVGRVDNGTLGVYWLAEENNTVLHVNISAPGSLRNVQCVGKVQTCTQSNSCERERRNSPTIMILNTIGKCLIYEVSPCVQISSKFCDGVVVYSLCVPIE